jgi:hypothetical protein
VTRVAPTPALARLRGEFPAPVTPRVILHRGTCGDAAQSDAAWQVVRAAIEGVTVSDGACDGACWAAPAATVQREGHQHRFAHLDEGVPDDLLSCVAGVCADEYAGRGAYGLLEWLGRQDGTFEDAVTHGAYASLAHANAIGGLRAMDAFRLSSFAGRYGALLEGGVLGVAAEQDSPNTFIDRHLLEGDPHRVIEGILVACRATEVSDASVHLGGQPASAGRAFRAALAQAGDHGILDGSALGGAAISIEVTDAPSEGEAMRIEAVSALTALFDTPPPPTRLVALSGAVPRPGLYETPLGGATTWTGILAMAGATPALVPGLQVGGSGDLVRREEFEDAVTPAALGDGSVVVLPRDAEV